MKDLAAALGGLGARRVRTCVQSGNAVFDATIDDVERFARDLGNASGASHGFVREEIAWI